jgi:hypothetical protein
MHSLQLQRLATAFVAASACWLAGCEQLGIESATVTAAKREAEGKAIGGGCRHAARSIEQCYETNKRADKAAVFAGWREMEDYMRDNKIAAVPAPAPAAAETKLAGGDAHDDEPAEPARTKPAAKAAPARKGS